MNGYPEQDAKLMNQNNNDLIPSDRQSEAPENDLVIKESSAWEERLNALGEGEKISLSGCEIEKRPTGKLVIAWGNGTIAVLTPAQMKEFANFFQGEA